MIKNVICGAFVLLTAVLFIIGIRAIREGSKKKEGVVLLSFSALSLLVAIFAFMYSDVHSAEDTTGSEPNNNITSSGNEGPGLNVVPDSPDNGGPGHTIQAESSEGDVSINSPDASIEGDGNNTVQAEGDDEIITQVDGDGNTTIYSTIGGGENNSYGFYFGIPVGNYPFLTNKYAPPNFFPDFEQVSRLSVLRGDSMGGRDAYTIDEINAGAIDGQIVFNSISDSVIGHEFDFVGARENTGTNLGDNNKWNGNAIRAEEGKTYLVRLYVHNNSRWRSDIAEDVSIRFSIGDTKAVLENDVALNGVNSGDGYYGAVVYGFISASNAVPSEYWDGVKFVSERPFHLEYIPGTATYENNGIGSSPGYRLSNDIVTSGVPIGFSAMDGRIPGCYTYSSYSSIVVMPVFEDCAALQ